MKGILGIKVPFKRKPTTIKPVYNWRTPPVKVESYDPYENICRIFPRYVADHYTFFELLPPPRENPMDKVGYVSNLKKKISCMKAESLI